MGILPFHMKRFAEVVYLVVPVGGVIYGAVTHDSYGMGYAICGIIGGGLGLIIATLVILVSAVVLSIVCGHRRFQPRK